MVGNRGCHVKKTIANSGSKSFQAMDFPLKPSTWFYIPICCLDYTKKVARDDELVRRERKRDKRKQQYTILARK